MSWRCLPPAASTPPVRTQDPPVVRRAGLPRSTDARVRKRRVKTAGRVPTRRGSGAEGGQLGGGSQAERGRLSVSSDWSVAGGTLSHLTMGVSSQPRDRRSCWGRETPPAHAGGIQFRTCEIHALQTVSLRVERASCPGVSRSQPARRSANRLIASRWSAQ